ncbi:helix-loop-helix DNA-binding domain-containing protein [Favolaschia claudopus]|uniref:Helix-loop-helix DNA-binding domain-containing protein n=1 Tax=Favolaschia claudopus TaxID=2862362 RepID=A0AAW0E6F2_9AGAR
MGGMGGGMPGSFGSIGGMPGSLGGMPGSLGGAGMSGSFASVGSLTGMPGSMGGIGMPGNGSGGGAGGSNGNGANASNGASGGNGNGGSGGNANGSAAEGKVESKASVLANEKRRRRRESHNAVERRRRDNINEKISELATLIPECMLEGGAVTGGQNQNQGQPHSPGSPDDALLSPTTAASGGEWPLVLPSGTKKEVDDDSKDAKDAGVVKANKGMILRKSVEYIRYLQQLVAAQGARNRELEEQLKSFRGSSAGSASPPSLDLGLGGGWGAHANGLLASMPEGDDESGDGMGMGMGLGMGMGMDVDGGDIDSPDVELPGKRERGRKTKRTNGAASEKGVKTKSPTKRKVKKVEEDEEESDLSDDGMDV